MIATPLRRVGRAIASRAARAARAGLSLLVVAAVVPVAFAPAVAAAAPVTAAHLYAVDFVDASTGYAVGSGGTVVKTTDGGVHWATVRSGDSYELRGVSFIDANNGWVMSLTGVGFKTTDGGATWTSLTADIGGIFYTNEQVYALARIAAEEGVAVGTAQGLPAVGFHKYSSSSSWLNNTSPELWGGSYDPPETEPPFPKAGAGVFYGMDFVSASRGWVVGHDTYTGIEPAADAPMVWDYSSTYGTGSSRWRQQTVTGVGALFDVAFASTTQGVAVGHDGMVQRTSDGGTTWVADDVGNDDEFYGVELTPTGESWAVGEWGHVMRSADNGDTWTDLTSPTGSQLEDIEWLSGDTAVAVGAAGAIIRTTNGSTWVLSNDEAGAVDPPVMNTLTSSSHPSETTWVKNSTVSAAWSATAGQGATIAGYGVVLDQSASTVPGTQTTTNTSGSFSASNGSGDYWLHASVKDSTGQWGNTLHRKVRVDVTAPSATFAPNESGYDTSASIPLSATDAHSGVASVSYKIDGGSTTTVSATSTNVVVSGIGTHDVTYWASDNVGNVTGQVTKQVVIFVDPPVMNTLTSSSHPSETTWYNTASINAAWSASAGGQAISGYGVVLDQSASTVPAVQTTTNTSGSFTAGNGSGEYWLHARAKDTGGQWSNTLHRRVQVDTAVPSATFSPAASYAGSASVPLTATDAHSGIASVSYTIDGGSAVTVPGASTTVHVDTAGTHDITYWATDNAGNQSAALPAEVTVTTALTPVERKVEGAGRYATAIESAKLHFTTPMTAGPDGHKWVVIASGTNWPDALAASGLAGALDAPLLLTTPDDLRPEVATYIGQLGANRAAIVGGTAAVSSAVSADLAALVGGTGNVVRYGESSRYATANRIAIETVTVSGRDAWDGAAFLGTGGNFPDALAAAPLSAAKGRPLYLAQPTTGVSDATIAAMKTNGVSRVIVLGGTGVVPESSITRLKAQGITDVVRWNGTDRYDTARVVAENSIAEGLSPQLSGLATGTNFPDALAGGVAQGLSGSVLVLTSSTTLSPAARTYFANHHGQIAEIRFFGGNAAVSTAVRQAALNAAMP